MGLTKVQNREILLEKSNYATKKCRFSDHYKIRTGTIETTKFNLNTMSMEQYKKLYRILLTSSYQKKIQRDSNIDKTKYERTMFDTFEDIIFKLYLVFKKIKNYNKNRFFGFIF